MDEQKSGWDPAGPGYRAHGLAAAVRLLGQGASPDRVAELALRFAALIETGQLPPHRG